MVRVPQMACGSSLGTRHSLLSQVFIPFAPPASLYRAECVCVCVCIDISDTVQTVYELPLLPNNTAVKTVTPVGAVRSADCRFIVVVPVWR